MTEEEEEEEVWHQQGGGNGPRQTPKDTEEKDRAWLVQVMEIMRLPEKGATVTM